MADPRLTPARGDVAADFLKDQVDADRYDPGMAYQVSSSVLPLRRTPAPDGPQETQVLFGEIFTVYDEKDGWGWGQADFDNYVGYVDMAGLSAPVDAVTHRVTALRSYRFSAPNLKSAPLGLISMNAKLAIAEEEGDYVRETRGGWLWRGHVAPMAERAADPVGVATKFLGAPYFWGGRESLGLDCSSLLQNAFEAAGQIIPRDTDLQEAYFSKEREILWEGPSEKKGGGWRDLTLAR
ncbi:MAG: SH3 domain-containing protein, partial [Pseudomonadota bacterium]